LDISNGGKVTVGRDAATGEVIIGYTSDATGKVTIDGLNSALNALGYINVGNEGNGTLKVSNNGVVTAGTYISTGLRSGGNGTLKVSNNGVVTAGTDIYLGYGSGSEGTLEVSNKGVVTAGTSIYLGSESGSEGTLSITSGGVVECGAFLVIGYASIGTATVSGSNSRLSAGSQLQIGGTSAASGEGTLDVTNGGTATAAYIIVGINGIGRLNITNGGTATTPKYLILGAAANGNGEVLVSGPNSRLEIGENLRLGYGGNGTLTIENNGKVTMDFFSIAMNAGSTGVLNLQPSGTLSTNYIVKGAGASAKLYFNGGTLIAPSTQTNFFRNFSSGDIVLTAPGDGSAALNFNVPAAASTVTINNTPFTGTGTFAKTGAGAVILADTSSIAGTLQVKAGTVYIDSQNITAGNLLVDRNATLAGVGTLSVTTATDITINGNVSPGTPGNPVGILKLSSVSNVTFAPGARFLVDLRSETDSDVLVAGTGNIDFTNATLEVRIDPSLMATLKTGDEFVIAEAVHGAIAGSIISQFSNVRSVELEQHLFLKRNGIYIDFTVEVRPTTRGAEAGDVLVLRTISVNPEPSTYAIFGGAGLLLLAFWRKRRQRSGART
jgi:T5SS/PEP-CTERM-associated repeat protein/autotransporter-associated beta strand protein